MIPSLATCSSFSSSFSSSIDEEEEDETKLYSFADSQKWSQTINRATSHPEEARYQDMFLDTALHRACTSNPPVEVIHALLTAHPLSTSIQDSSGYTPLHCACVFGASFEVVSRLIEADISSIHAKNVDGNTPLQQLCHQYFQTVRRRQMMSCSDTNRLSPSNQIPDSFYPVKHSSDCLIHFWNNANLLVMAANRGTIQYSDKPWKMVHACAEMEGCPQDLIRLAIHYHPEQVEEKDQSGRLPLHIALSNSSQEDDDNSNGVFQAILEASPSAVTIKEEQSHLYPFMLGAVGEKSSLTKMYQMLRSCPEMERFTAPKRSSFL